MSENTNRLLATAEAKIHLILLDLDDVIASFGEKISGISVDTRNFANLAVEITVEDIRK